MKAVDARLKAAGVKSIGQRLRIQTTVQKAADNSYHTLCGGTGFHCEGIEADSVLHAI